MLSDILFQLIMTYECMKYTYMYWHDVFMLARFGFVVCRMYISHEYDIFFIMYVFWGWDSNYKESVSSII